MGVFTTFNVSTGEFLKTQVSDLGSYMISLDYDIQFDEETLEVKDHPKCNCKDERPGLVRPNVTMFEDYQWDFERSDIQQQQYKEF